MELEKLKLKNVLYFMQSFIITVGNTTFEVPRTMIGNFHVEKQFEEQVYPFYYVSLQLPLWVHEEMMKDPRNIFVTMNLQYTLVDDPDRAYAGSCQLITEINGRFFAFLSDTTQMADASHQNEIAKDSKSYKKNYEFNEGAMVEMILYNEKAYKASFNKLNTVLSGVTVTDALMYCTNACSISNILLDKADNTKTYSQFIILPQSGTKNILRITDEFRFHDDSTIVFFDLVDTYIISKKIGCRCWKNNEHKCVYIITQSQFSDTLENFTGVHIDNEQKFSVLAITPEDFSTQKPDSSPLLREQKQMNFLTITTANALLSLLTPNKEFQFTVDDNASNTYNGKYRIYSLTMDCSPKGEFLNPTFNIIFRK